MAGNSPDYDDMAALVCLVESLNWNALLFPDVEGEMASA